MIAMLALIALEGVLLVIFAPIGIGVKYHFSLSRDKSIVIVKALGVEIIKINIEEKEGKFNILLNGKPFGKRKSKNFPANKISKFFDYIRAEKLVGSLHFLAYVGGSDAMDCAIKCAAAEHIANMLRGLLGAGIETTLKGKKDKSLLFADFANNRLDLNVRLRAKLNLYQLTELAVTMRRDNK